MRNANQKAIQKQVNKIVKQINKEIYNDSLWLGRFYTHQVKSDYVTYGDGSGGELHILLKFEDRKTGIYMLERFDVLKNDRFIANEIFRAMNDFIVDIVEVWHNEDPYNNIIDYRKEGR